jgi:hypothetical protein
MTTPVLRVFALGLLAAALEGCGGKVVIDDVATGTGGGPSTSSSSSGGPHGDCPVLAPNEGDPCGSPVLGDNFQCLSPLCCGGTLDCVGGAWHLSLVPCAEPCIACGNGPGCAIDAVCVHFGGGPTVGQAACAFNPCMNEPLACTCAGSLCADHGGCFDTSGSEVVCTPAP